MRSGLGHEVDASGPGDHLETEQIVGIEFPYLPEAQATAWRVIAPMRQSREEIMSDARSLLRPMAMAESPR